MKTPSAPEGSIKMDFFSNGTNPPLISERNLDSRKAHELYRQGDFYGAIKLYHRLARTIGHHLFSANIALCLNNLQNNDAEQTSYVLNLSKNGKTDILKEIFSDKIVVSLTSYPARINTVHIAIKSLLEQSFTPTKLILWLAEDQFPNKEQDLPNDLLKLRDTGLEIEWCEDLKSYKKLIPSLRRFPHKTIVTADDDIIYGKDWLLQLVLSHAQYPDNIVCHRAHRVQLNESGDFAKYTSWTQDVKNTNSAFSNFFTGCGGVLYPPNSLHKSVIDERTFSKLCAHGDDIWFWGMSVLNSTKIRPVTNSDFDLSITPDTQATALWRANVRGQNDLMIKSMLEHFPELKSKIKEEKILPEEVKVSIIIPVYNAGEYLKSCLNSVIGQSFKSIEILCIDDGSTDPTTLDILKEYSNAHQPIRVIRQENAGPATARNTGLNNVTGTYVSFVDSDDLISENYIQNLYTAALKHNADICVADKILCIDHTHLKTAKNSGYELYGEIDSKQLAANAIITTGVSWNKLYRREFLAKNNIRYIDGMRCQAEDNFFSITAAVLGFNNLCLAEDATYFWRQHDASITKNVTKASWLDSLSVYEITKNNIKALGVSDSVFWINTTNHRALRDLKYNAKQLKEKDEVESHLLTNFSSKVDVCCIADENYIIPTLVFLESMRKAKAKFTDLSISILVPKGSRNNMIVLEQIVGDNFSAKVIEIDASRFEGLHKKKDEDNYCMASPSAMFKFIIPEIFNDLDRILYIDTDLIVRKDMLELFMSSMKDEYLCAVVDMWAPITDREETKVFKSYFNSGVMLMNLAKMRADSLPLKLIEAKLKSQNFNLMDQDVFNEVCSDNVKTLDIKYNFLPVCYKRHEHRFKLDVLNKIYRSNYESVAEIALDPHVVHWAGSDKPWKTTETLFADEWLHIHQSLVTNGLLKSEFSASA